MTTTFANYHIECLCFAGHEPNAFNYHKEHPEDKPDEIELITQSHGDIEIDNSCQLRVDPTGYDVNERSTMALTSSEPSQVE